MAASTSPSGSVACTPLPEIYGHSRKVYALEFNSNGTFLASGSNDRSIRVWSIGSNVCLVLRTSSPFGNPTHYLSAL